MSTVQDQKVEEMTGDATKKVKTNQVKNILLLGAGYVSTTVVEYLTRRKENKITIATRSIEKAKQRQSENAHDPSQINIEQLDIEKDDEKLEKLIGMHDLVISLVPYVHHVKVASAAIRQKTDMVTSSYISPAMRALNDKAVEAGITIMNEIGVDPGIDHLGAVRIIREAQRRGGKVRTFTSWCGGLPAPEDIGDNPLKYKFSWSPKGVLMAGGNEARYLENGQTVIVPPQELLRGAVRPLNDLDDTMKFEGYPNRDSTLYAREYAIPEARNILRGTLRFQGFTKLMTQLKGVGLASFAEKDMSKYATWNQVTAELLGSEANEVALTTALVQKLKLDDKEAAIATNAFKWIGLFSDSEQVANENTIADAFSLLLQKKMSYGPNERDMIFLQHIFEIEEADGKITKLRSTLESYAQGKYSAMARTTGYPCAIAVQLVLDKVIAKLGVFGPMEEEINNPIIDALKIEKIEMVDTPMN